MKQVLWLCAALVVVAPLITATTDAAMPRMSDPLLYEPKISIPSGAVRGYVTFRNRVVANAVVQLLRADGSVYATTSTSFDGQFRFFAVPINQNLSVRASYLGRSGVNRNCAYFVQGSRNPALGCNVGL